MKRRSFVKLSAPFTLGSILGKGLNPIAIDNFGLSAALNCNYTDRSVVIIQLLGGNDGLNMLVPLDQYDRYKQLRPTIGLPNTGLDAVINLDNTLPTAGQLGLHPTMTGLKDLYDAGKVKIIQGVGYPGMNRSHFAGVDLWLKGNGAGSKYNYNTGWMGRFLKASYPNLIGRPTLTKPDPVGIRLSGSSLAFHVEGSYPTNVKINQDPAAFYNQVQNAGLPPIADIPNSDHGKALRFISSVENTAKSYSGRISETFNAGTNTVSYPDNSLSNQLKSVARLISGGCKTKVFYTAFGEFDTHGGQVVSGNPTIGTHANYLQELSSSIKAFQTDLTNQNLDNQVLSATFSEFGRTAYQNGSSGTGHGTSAPMLLIGSGLNPGVLGDVPTLSNLSYYWSLVQYDYRSVFSTILQDWLGADGSIIDSVGFNNFIGNKPPLILDSMKVDPSCYYSPS
ncbi:MAG: DUF1501 domain-containing protein [Saprospiraceae bacterium]